ncbi:hypothetical protein [Mesorhizobium sp.]|uniref:hypothetical protein n=1 Tax=Mesorhizobium sp. TaxID=1871066 RepID=UPI0025F04BCF|nr:hypothetical protein [Mesorhizobium sp.]
MQTDRNWLIGVGLALIAPLFCAAMTLTTRAVKGGRFERGSLPDRIHPSLSCHFPAGSRPRKAIN